MSYRKEEKDGTELTLNELWEEARSVGLIYEETEYDEVYHLLYTVSEFGFLLKFYLEIDENRQETLSEWVNDVVDIFGKQLENKTSLNHQELFDKAQSDGMISENKVYPKGFEKYITKSDLIDLIVASEYEKSENGGKYDPLNDFINKYTKIVEVRKKISEVDRIMAKENLRRRSTIYSSGNVSSAFDRYVEYLQSNVFPESVEKYDHLLKDFITDNDMWELYTSVKMESHKMVENRFESFIQIFNLFINSKENKNVILGFDTAKTKKKLNMYTRLPRLVL
jgi:hypothetical protein